MKRDPRVDELLVARALHGLTEAEADELRRLGGEGDAALDAAVAALDLATAPSEPLPEDLAKRILADAQVQAFTGPGAVPAPKALVRPRSSGASPWPAWLAAAAGVFLAIGAWGWALSRPPAVVVGNEVLTASAPLAIASAPPVTPAPTPSAAPTAAAPAEERAKLLATEADAKVVPWKATKDPAGRGASGDVVWSASAQKGYMRFVNLAANDRTREQYQLWIFDKKRDARYPVDGGVFDVTSGGEVVVPIDAKLHVEQATLFAVTAEKPGGVVVSSRKRIVVAATPAG